MRLRYSILRQLVVVQTAIAELKIDLDEHLAYYDGTNKSLIADLIRAKIALEQHKEQEFRMRLADMDELTKKSRDTE